MSRAHVFGVFYGICFCFFWLLYILFSRHIFFDADHILFIFTEPHLARHNHPRHRPSASQPNHVPQHLVISHHSQTRIPLLNRPFRLPSQLSPPLPNPHPHPSLDRKMAHNPQCRRLVLLLRLPRQFLCLPSPRRHIPSVSCSSRPRKCLETTRQIRVSRIRTRRIGNVESEY